MVYFEKYKSASLEDTECVLPEFWNLILFFQPYFIFSFKIKAISILHILNSLSLPNLSERAHTRAHMGWCNIYRHTYLHIWDIHVDMRTHPYTHKHIYTYTRKHMHAYTDRIYRNIHTHTEIHACTHRHTFTQTYIYSYIYAECTGWFCVSIWHRLELSQRKELQLRKCPHEIQP